MEVISQMLQTGAEVQEQNVKAMRDVFDAFWNPKDAAPEPGKASAEPGKPTAPPPPPEAAPKPAAAPGSAPSARRKPGTRT